MRKTPKSKPHIRLKMTAGGRGASRGSGRSGS